MTLQSAAADSLIQLSTSRSRRSLPTDLMPGRARILVAEDDEDVAQGLAVLLAPIFEIAVLESAHDFLRSFESDRPDVMLVDYQLPDMNGVRLLQTIRRREGSYTPAVMVSAYPSRRQASLRAGFESFIEKPFNPLDIIWAIERALAKP